MKKLLCIGLVVWLLLLPAANASALECHAASAVLLDSLTGKVLYAKNENERRAIASTTKIMTALLVLENTNLDRQYTVRQSDADMEGSSLGIRAGEVLTIRSLLYGLMIVSGNDAATALANACAGSKNAFVKQMNEKAALLGLKNTHFTNPAGLSEQAHYSTALDMARLTRYALRVKGFEEICSSSEQQIRFLSPEKTITLHNHNRLLNEYKGCIGVKTGFTEAAGRCLVSAARRNGQTLIAVTLRDADDWNDHKAMLDEGFRQSTCYQAQISVPNIPLVGARQRFAAFSFDPASVYVPESELENLQTCIYAPHFIYAPVFEGEKIGEAVIFYKDKPIQTIPLYASQTIQRQSETGAFSEIIKSYGKFRSKTAKIYGRQWHCLQA